MLTDNTDLRSLINTIYPNFEVTDTAKQSGQRTVYFGSFTGEDKNEPTGCQSWGEVVLKISQATSRAAISYFQKEVEILSDLNSEAFPTLYFYETISQHPKTEDPIDPILIITIEQYIDASPLTNVMHNYADQIKVCDFLIQVTQSLSALWSHPQKLVHRDLKPDNILIRDNNNIVIIDLGLLRQEGATGVTNSLNTFGPCTPNYASPEQAKNEKRNISFRSDLFSLGVICYEMLSKKNPFVSGDNGNNFTDDVLARIVEHTPPPLSTFGFNVDLSKIIEKIMQKQPYMRYRTIQSLLADLMSVRENL